MLRFIAISIVVVAAVALGYPIAAVVTHGFDPTLWPPVAMTPGQWFQSFVATYGLHNAGAYVDMASMRSPAFAGGGLIQALPHWHDTTRFCRLAARFETRTSPGSRRAPGRCSLGYQGGAGGHEERSGIRSRSRHRKAHPRCRRRQYFDRGAAAARQDLRAYDPNLAVADANAWNGPAVVIDPKAEAFLAVAERRRALHRYVRCLDPMNLCGGTDRWNPLAGLDPANIVYLQRVARTLLPPTISEENAYFQNRAVDAIVAAFLAAHSIGNPTPLAVSNLLSSAERLAEAPRRNRRHHRDPRARAAQDGGKDPRSDLVDGPAILPMVRRSKAARSYVGKHIPTR